ncbi:hypothetical protein M0Q28_03910 [Patescibacteria group bacterium]|jgi:hypothetical protein|nr:hypothetical protein [Patescibacteria group bacterium]
MKFCNLFLTALLAWFVPTFASAQDSLRESLEDRARSVEIDGHAFYRLRAQGREPYAHLVALAAPGTTEDQIDALNPHHVNYRCIENGRGRVPPTRNGIEHDDGSITDRIDYATFASTRCADGSVRRELVEGMMYLIPREIIRSPGEELDDITHRITIASATEVRDVARETNDPAQALIARGAPPSSVGAYASALSAAVDRVSATAETPGSDMTFEVPEEPAVDTASAERVAQLETELAAARATDENRVNRIWFMGILCLLLVAALFWALVTRKVGIIDMRESEKIQLRQQLNGEWQRKLDDAVRVADTTTSLQLVEVLTVFNEETKQKVTVENLAKTLREYLKKAEKALLGVAQTSLAVSVPTPPPAKNPFEATENNYREIFRAVDDGALKNEKGLDGLLLKLGRMVDQSAKATLAFLLTSTHRHLQLQTAWAGSFGDAVAFDEERIDQLARGVHPGLERAVTDAVQARDRAHADELNRFGENFDEERRALNDRIETLVPFETEVGVLRRELEEAKQAKPSDDGTLLAQISVIREKLFAIWRGEFGSILAFHQGERRRVVDGEKIMEKFSLKRVFQNPAKGKKGEKMTIHELRGPTLNDFLRIIHEEGFGKALEAMDRLLGLAPELHDQTPAPGTHTVPDGEQPSLETLTAGHAPLPAAVPAIETPVGLGTEPLADQDEGETTERPVDLGSAIAAAAAERAAEDASGDGEDELASEPTRFMVNPLLTPPASLKPEPTKPYAKGLDADADADVPDSDREPTVIRSLPLAPSGHGNGNGRDADATTRVRRDTVRGMPAALPDAPQPPIALPEPPAEGESNH